MPRCQTPHGLRRTRGPRPHASSEQGDEGTKRSSKVRLLSLAEAAVWSLPTGFPIASALAALKSASLSKLPALERARALPQRPPPMPEQPCSAATERPHFQPQQKTAHPNDPLRPQVACATRRCHVRLAAAGKARGPHLLARCSSSWRCCSSRCAAASSSLS